MPEATPEPKLWLISPLSQAGSIEFYLLPVSPSIVIASHNFKERQEIGWYEAALPRAVYDEMSAAVKAAKLDSLPQPKEIRPDERFVFINQDTDGQTDFKQFQVGRVPPIVQQLTDRLLRAALPVLDHPKWVLQGKLLEPPRGLGLDDPLAFSFSLTNVGSLPVQIDNPLRRDKAGWTGLRLIVVPDKPPVSELPAESAWIDLDPKAVRPVPEGAARPSPKLLSLKPGETVKVAVRKKLLLSPGRYRATLTFLATALPEDRARVGGELVMDLGAFDVALGATPR